MNTKIYVAYHKWAPRVQGGVFAPIHVGRALADAPIEGMIGDDEGDHISSNNGAMCELTALYWAWKNDRESERIGLMHYRRVLDVLGQGALREAETYVAQLDVVEWTTQASDQIQIDNVDLIVPRAHIMGRTVEDNYKHTHSAQDWDVLRNVIHTDFADYVVTFESVAKGHVIRLGNLLVMTRAMLDRYCTFLFGVLEKVQAADIDRSQYSTYQGRYLGFLGERLLTVFVEHELRYTPHLRMKEVGILNLDQAMVMPYFADVDRPDPACVNLAFSADHAYLPHCAAMVRTVLDHANPSRPINLFFLYSGIESSDLDALRCMISNARSDAQLHAINTGTLFASSYRSDSRGPSNATYNRFLLFALLARLDRVLYLDSDVIVQRDICELYDVDLGHAYVGAVTDWIMTRALSGPTATADPAVPDLGEYHRDVLGLTRGQTARYFNAGIMVINFAAMNDLEGLRQTLMSEARDGRYLFRDQDILNKVFKDDLQCLDARWNVFNTDASQYHHVPHALRMQALAARSDPWIIHFADRAAKPWLGHAVPHAELYWGALMRTPFWPDVTRSLTQTVPLAKGRFLAWGKALAYRVPVLKRPLMWLYQIWRQWL